MTPRPPATDEEREDQSLTLRPTGTPVLDRSQGSLFPGLKTLGGRAVKRASSRESKHGRR
jgi:hypothetical protein